MASVIPVAASGQTGRKSKASMAGAGPRLQSRTRTMANDAQEGISGGGGASLTITLFGQTLKSIHVCQ
jgi:3-phosphoglycerate kinase